jgi:hypothetical protein
MLSVYLKFITFTKGFVQAALNDNKPGRPDKILKKVTKSDKWG